MAKMTKKLIAVFLAILTIFSTLAVGLTAFAATKEDVYLINLPRGEDPVQSGWGHPALNFMNGWWNDEYDYTTVKSVMLFQYQARMSRKLSKLIRQD